MKRVDMAALEMNIYVQLKVLRGPTKTALQHVRSDMACKTVARLIIERCLSNLAMFEPSEHYRRYGKHEFGSMHGGSGYVHGKFGQSEPWPLPPLDPPSPDRCRLCTANNVDVLGEELAKAMWRALVPEVPFENAGDHRASFLLIAHHAIHWLDRT